MIKVAICDDNENIVNEIKAMLTECCNDFRIVADIYTYDKGKKLEQSVNQGKCFDLLYLDIQMEDQDGIQTAKNIRKLDPNVFIIYISGYDRYIEEIFDVSASNFIRKPIKKERFQKTLQEVCEKIKVRSHYFEYVVANRAKKISFHEIVYFESCGRKIVVHLQNGQADSFYGKIRDIEKEIDMIKLPFIRVHQSFLVNFEYITNRSRNEIKVVTGDCIPISRDHQKQFLAQYTKYLGREIHE